VRRFDGFEDVRRGVIHAGYDVAVSLGISGPEDDDTVKLILLLEATDVGADVLEVGLFVRARNKVVCASLLVGSDEIGVVNGRKRLAEVGHVRSDLALQVPIKNLGALHSLVHGETRDVPATEDKVVGVDHRQDIRDGDMNVLASGGIHAKADSGGTKHRANVVRLLDPRLGVPRDVVTVGENSGAKRRTVVAAHTNHHETEKTVSINADGS
jgi:hypothetical protein